MEGKCPGTRRPDATRLHVRRLGATCRDTLCLVDICFDTRRLEGISLDTLHLEGKYPVTRHPDTKRRGTPRPDGRHMSCHSSFGRGGYALTLIARKANTLPIFV
jgi:hypothetical protein